MPTTADLTVRAAADEDLPRILELLQASLGWVPDDQYADFFRWKHQHNPFGTSPTWVATMDDRIVGLRTWLRWRFEDAERTYTAVRAVDTATHPDVQGRGIFRTLTMHGVEQLTADGVDFVFNTPNEQSRPGYLKMGWDEVGKLPIGVRFSSVGAAARAVAARTPADKWSVPTDAGTPAEAFLADDGAVAGLLQQRGAPGAPLRTRLDADVLRWRYGFGPLHYRALHGDGGTVLFRLRRRGPSTEAVVELLAGDGPEASGRLLRHLARETGADHVLRITARPLWRAGELPLPGQGPVLTWRALAYTTSPPLERWQLDMGDVELF